ncbi:MAG: polyphosphate polymerase domain-containing protein [Chthoniobacteraceae bacterium]
MKFAVSAAQREALMTHLSPHLRRDENAGSSARYPVVSLYYDNAERDCYWEKARSLPSRRKLRVRVYGSRDGTVPAVSFVEIKHKCEGRGVKRRVLLPLAQALCVCKGREPEGVTLGGQERRIIAEVHDLVNRRGFGPVMVMRYDRSAFVGVEPGSDLRVTFDEGIRARLGNLTPEPDDRRFEPGDEMQGDGGFVMEVKVTGCVPYWLSRTIAAAGCCLQSLSKYSAALEQRDPVLRAMLAPNWRACFVFGGAEKVTVFSPMTAPASALRAG